MATKCMTEKQDAALDKKKGVKEGSKADLAQDKKVGVKDKKATVAKGGWPFGKK